MKNLPLTTLLILALASLSLMRASCSADVSPSVWGNCQVIDEGWLYLENNGEKVPKAEESQYQAINLPHTWNAEDTLSTKDYRRDASWYRKHLHFSAKDLTSRHFLRFGAAGQEARVYVNGQLVGEHRGGYAAFTLEITDSLQAGNNRIDVRVSNAENLDLGPYNADFNFYGGLYRSVQLVRAPRTCLSRTTRGGPGIRVWSNRVNEEVADLRATVTIDNSREKARWLRVRAELLDPLGRVVSFVEKASKVTGVVQFEMKLNDVVSPRLWSPENPQLYQLRVQLMEDNIRLDEATISYGFRWCKFTRSGQFFLNGKPYDLHGVNRHQDLEGFGNAVPRSHHERDIQLIKEVGANWLRLAHYQQDDYVLELCDQLGILVWEEIPYVNVLTDTQAFRDNYETMLRELIEQHHNHPSIIMWGVQNEIFLRQEGKLLEEKVALAKHLAAVAKEEDPRRVIVQAGHGTSRYGEMGLPEFTDVMGYNVYYGWYGGKPEDLTENMEKLRLLSPDRPHVISEYGAGSDIRIHAESPRSQDFSEEWQVHYLESYLDQFEEMNICGSLWWNMFDFGSATRGDSISHVNQKGILTFDHQTKKDVWYLMKSRWSKDPVLYLASPHFTNRKGDPKKSYRVLTNFDEVELFHQGKSLGLQKEGFRWEVTLLPGENQLLARGQKAGHRDQHGFVVTYKPTKANAQPKIDLKNYEPRKAEWKLLWADEFTKAGLPDPEIWELEEGYIRNEELQYYTVGRAKNARVEGGNLIIEAHKEHIKNPKFNPDSKRPLVRREFTEFTSASVTTKGKKDLLYGKIEIRAKLPAGRGVWPAAWLLGRKFDGMGWPLCGELDIMEHVGYTPTSVWTAVHTQDYNWTKGTQKKGFVTLPDLQGKFHTYSVHWFSDRIEGFVDGKCHFLFLKEDEADTAAWPFDSPFHMILNLAIGGGLGGKQGVDDSIFPQRLEIDYVRVYQEMNK